MTLPNKITVYRILLVPIIIAFLIWDATLMSSNGKPKFTLFETLNGNYITIPYLISGLLFIIAASSDVIDGYLARKNNQITN